MTSKLFTRLEFARRCRGESIEQCAVHSGVGARYISRAECGHGISDLHLKRLADYFGIGDPDTLLEEMRAGEVA